MCVCVCVCVCVNFKGWGQVFQLFPTMQVFDTMTQSFDTRKALHLKETLSKLLKSYLKDNGNIYFVVI